MPHKLQAAVARARDPRAAQPVLHTQRLVLRPVLPSDAAMIELYAGEQRLSRMTTSIPHPLPPGATEAFVDKCIAPDAREAVWAITLCSEIRDELIGLIGLDDQGEVGYWIGAPFWRLGYATEAVSALLPYAFDAPDGPGFDGLVATVFQDNPGSARVLAKAGFTFTGEDEAFSVARSATAPRWCYRLTAEDWRARRA